MKALVTSVRCEVLGGHCHVSVWTRGGKAGVLVVDAADGIKLAAMLVPHGCEKLSNVTGVYHRWALAQASVKRAGYLLTATQDDEDESRVVISLNGEDMGAARWDGESFDRLPFRPSLLEAENEAAREALETAYADAVARLEAVS